MQGVLGEAPPAVPSNPCAGVAVTVFVVNLTSAASGVTVKEMNPPSRAWAASDGQEAFTETTNRFPREDKTQPQDVTKACLSSQLAGLSYKPWMSTFIMSSFLK